MMKFKSDRTQLTRNSALDTQDKTPTIQKGDQKYYLDTSISPLDKMRYHQLVLRNEPLHLLHFYSYCFFLFVATGIYLKA